MTFSGEVMKRLTIKEASKMLGIAEQGTRMLIQLGRIPGATYIEGEEGRKTYYITDEQVLNMMKGART